MPTAKMVDSARNELFEGVGHEQHRLYYPGGLILSFDQAQGLLPVNVDDVQYTSMLVIQPIHQQVV